MDNCFILLGLPFDPPETDIKKIEEAIREKESKWRHEVLGKTSRSVEASKCLAQLDHIKEVMLNENSRWDEAKKAKGAKEDKRADLEKKLEDYRAIGDTLEEWDVGRLLGQFGPYGYTEGDIRRLFDMGRREKARTIDPENVLGRKDAEKLEKALKKLRVPGETVSRNGVQILRPPTLYNFLRLISSGISSDSPTDRLYAVAKAEGDKILHKGGRKTAEDDAKQSLCALCVKIFCDGESRRMYDDYIELTKYAEVNDVADTLALRNHMEITPRMREGLIDVAVRRCALSVPEASAYVGGYCAYMGYAMSDGKVVCGRCGAENPGGSLACSKCGKILAIRCPSCKQLCDADAIVCNRCKFKLENAVRAKELCGQADQAVQALDFPAAAARLAEVDRLWPNNKLVPPLRSRLEEFQRRAAPQLAKLREAVGAKRYMEARERYEAVKNSFLDYRDQALEEEMTTAADSARSVCGRARRAARKEEVLALCAEAAALCADLPEIQALRAKYPPDPPGGFSVKADPRARENRLSWSARSGAVEYIVVRSHTGRVQSTADGEKVFRGKASSYWDKDIEAGVTYWYNVFAERDGVLSQGAAEGGREAVNLFEMGPVSVTPGNGSLRLSWGTPPRGAAVELYRSGPRGEERLASTREDSFLVTGLANEMEQRFRIALSYASGGRRVETEGVTVSGSPVCPPAQVDALRVQPAPGGLYEAVWRHAGQGEVRVAASARRPGWRAGAVVPLPALEREMTFLQMLPLSPASAGALGQGERGASFRDPGGEILYVTAVTVKSGSAVFGPLVRTGRGVSVAVRDICPVNGRVHIFLDAPRDASGFAVLYRFDRFPADPSDPESVKIYCTREQYALNNAVLLDALEARIYYFSVFAWFDQDGRREWSSGAGRVFDCSPKEVIAYSVSPARGVFGRRSVTLEFEIANKVLGPGFVLPDIDVMSAVGTAPLHKDAATLLYAIQGGRYVKGPVRVKVPLPKELPKDTYIKPFLRNEADQARQRLRLKVGSNHKIT